MKVLVVDDEVVVANFLCEFLRRLGLDAEKVHSAKEALVIFKQHQPEWVFLDIKIPDMDGLELLKKMKEINHQVKSIMVTGKDDETSQTQAHALGVYDYIIKPLDLEELYKIVNKHILNNE